MDTHASSLTPDARRNANRLLELLERRLEGQRRDGAAGRTRPVTPPAGRAPAPKAPRSD